MFSRFRLRARTSGLRWFSYSRATPPPSFGIAFDIDGVLLRGGKPIACASQTLRCLYDTLEQPAKLRIPYVLLTNGGGTTEASRAAELSKSLGVPISPHQVLQGHTPFKFLAERFNLQRVLAVGKGEPEVVLRGYGFSNVVHLDSYVNEFENIDGLGRFKPWCKPSSWHGVPNKAGVAGVFVVSDPVDWSRDIQVICDVLRSGGKPGREDGCGQPQPPLFFAADDLDYQSAFPVPRLGMGAFRVGLESIYNRFTGPPLQFVSYGKPQLIAYQNAQLALEEISGKMRTVYHKVNQERRSSSLKTIYMIGDNPSTDIYGAKMAGDPWFSLLTRTGCYRGQPINTLYQADKIVEDVEEAVDFILRRESLS